ncbi:hypothetical protein VC83_09677 [Pseudogymnoascus destructans]|uniref:FluG domain-containing protein n=2 Tax=Pseudogymnoascus destructans TaxID=655981 RepID=L8FTX7_PSED2|nr:uncharacterized protein VC83_09677 [Pseudogymnoascus destructans]ELR03151.1 hypothetical protein GMDG_05980 [Pseudogymnoascus destructans 20631-21]PQM43550.1 hypothetical protein VC83_09677 [Pseudogymnoascus destructans]
MSTRRMANRQLPTPKQNMIHFVTSRTRHAQQPKKPKRTAEDYRVMGQELNTKSQKPKDAEATKENVRGIWRKWTKFCKFQAVQDWRGAIEQCDRGKTMSFLCFICENYRVKAFNSVHQYLLQFKQLYNRVNGRHMDTNDAKEVFKYLDATLADEFKLRRTMKAKPVLGADDILLLLTHLWARDTSIFPTEDQRLTLATAMLLSIYTGCRLAELADASKRVGGKTTSRKRRHREVWDAVNDLDEDECVDEEEGSDEPNYQQQEPWANKNDTEYDDDYVDLDAVEREYKTICYEDIRLWIVRNPTQGERDLLGMEITFAHHKGADRKPKPTTFLFHEEALPILCPVSHVLSIAIKDNAIEVEGFSHAEPFFTSHLQHPTKAVLIHWKPEMLKRPIFRQAVRTCDMFRTSEWKALRYSTYAYYLDRLGWATGFEQKITSYCFRRGTGNAVDGAATTAVRDQILRHNPQTGVFCGSYINEKVRFIVQDAVLDQPTDSGFLRAFTHMSLTCDPRAPQTVPDNVRDALPPDPELVQLKLEQQELRLELKRLYGHAFVQGSIGTEAGEEYRQLNRQIATVTKTLEQELKREYRRGYFYRIHNEELEKIIKKVKVVTPTYVEPVVKHQLPEWTQLQDIMCDLSKGLNPRDIVMRRIHAIDTMVALSRRQEVQCHKSRLSKSSSVTSLEESPKVKEESPVPNTFPLECEKTQCIFCIGDDRQSYDRRMRKFSKPDKMIDHVERHLEKRTPGKYECCHPVCKAEGLLLNNVILFKNHVEMVHGIRLRDEKEVS